MRRTVAGNAVCPSMSQLWRPAHRNGVSVDGLACTHLTRKRDLRVRVLGDVIGIDAPVDGVVARARSRGQGGGDLRPESGAIAIRRSAIGRPGWPDSDRRESDVGSIVRVRLEPSELSHPVLPVSSRLPDQQHPDPDDPDRMGT
jgi:hypothetical protein